MIRRALQLITIISLICLAIIHVLGQNLIPSGAKASGNVVDANNNPVPSPAVTFYINQILPMVNTTVSADGNDRYKLGNVPPGVYSLGASSDNYLHTATARIGQSDYPPNLKLPVPGKGIVKLLDLWLFVHLSVYPGIHN